MPADFLTHDKTSDFGGSADMLGLHLPPEGSIADEANHFRRCLHFLRDGVSILVQNEKSDLGDFGPRTPS